jgi:hypothetical protein
MTSNGTDGAGHAVAGGAPGYAVIGGSVPMAEPTPIGVIQGRYAYAFQGPGGPGMPPGGRPGPGANPAAPGTADPSVLPSSLSTDPYDPVGHNRPHVLTHLFGLDAIGHRRREERERRNREKHASIAYQPSASDAVHDVPASVVYGRR